MNTRKRIHTRIIGAFPVFIPGFEIKLTNHVIDTYIGNARSEHEYAFRRHRQDVDMRTVFPSQRTELRVIEVDMAHDRVGIHGSHDRR